MRFEGSNALVTGGSSGIGYATAAALIAEGADRVYVTGRNAQALRAAADRLGEKAIPVVADASSLADSAALADRVRADGVTLDVLFANAGIAESRHFAETDEAFFDRTFDINVKGLFFQVQALLPVLADGASVIVNASIVANKGMANLSVYNASKAAVRSFARTWANDLKARGIRVNAVSPGRPNGPARGDRRRRAVPRRRPVELRQRHRTLSRRRLRPGLRPRPTGRRPEVRTS